MKNCPDGRITEFKALIGQTHLKTALVYEYPQAEGDPYYPFQMFENAALYDQYRKLAETTPHVHFVGRLVTYNYYNMDQVVAQALILYKKLTVPIEPAKSARPIIADNTALVDKLVSRSLDKD